MPLKPTRYLTLSPTQFMQQYHADPNAVLLDVRTHTEYQEQHLPNALQIDIKQDTFVDELDELNNTLNYYVYCRIGIRSANACETMRYLGFTGNLYNLKGGITQVPKEYLSTLL